MSDFEVVDNLLNLQIQEAFVLGNLSSLFLWHLERVVLTCCLELALPVGIVTAVAPRTVPLLKELAKLGLVGSALSRLRLSSGKVHIRPWLCPLILATIQRLNFPELLLAMRKSTLASLGARILLLSYSP